MVRYDLEVLDLEALDLEILFEESTDALEEYGVKKQLWMPQMQRQTREP